MEVVVETDLGTMSNVFLESDPSRADEWSAITHQRHLQMISLHRATKCLYKSILDIRDASAINLERHRLPLNCRRLEETCTSVPIRTAVVKPDPIGAEVAPGVPKSWLDLAAPRGTFTALVRLLSLKRLDLGYHMVRNNDLHPRKWMTLVGKAQSKRTGQCQTKRVLRLLRTAMAYSRASEVNCLPNDATSFVLAFTSLKLDRNKNAIESTTINLV